MGAKAKSKNPGCAGIIGLFLVAGLLGKACSGSNSPTTASLAPTQGHLQHPVRVTGNGINVRLMASANSSSLGVVSAADSVSYVARYNDQWSEVSLRNGTSGFISNKYLDGVAYVAPAAPAPHASKKPHPPRPVPHRRAPVALAYYCNSGNTVKYHASPDCRGLSRCGSSIVSMPLREAEASMDPCKWCY